jgi:HD-GYP domain-containing protein (c-di-GMP phosphodiesterase class II)
MPIEIPEISELRGEKAIKALSDAITELEEQNGNQLTDKQTEALIKIAKGMISSIQVEKEKPKPKKRTWRPFMRPKAMGENSL